MDVPRGLSWSELEKLAAHRDNWRERVRVLRRPPRVEVRMNENVAGTRAQKKKPTSFSPKQNKPATNTSKYQLRDAHEAFFRPREPATSSHSRRTRNTRSRAKTVKRKALTKPKALTDKERAAWARAHYHQHHGKQPTTPTPTTAPAPNLIAQTTSMSSPTHTPKLDSPTPWTTSATLPTPEPSDTNTSWSPPINNNINWSPIILGHHHSHHNTTTLMSIRH